MAERVPFGSVALRRTPEITTVPTADVSGVIASGLEEFSSRMQTLSRHFMEQGARDIEQSTDAEARKSVEGQFTAYNAAEQQRRSEFATSEQKRKYAAENAKQPFVPGSYQPEAPPTATLRQGNDRFSRAFNRAAMETYFDNLRISTGDAIERIHQQHQDDPAALDAGLTSYQQGIEDGLSKNMPELVTPFREYFDRSSRPYQHAAGEVHQRNVIGQQIETANAYLEARSRQDEKKAFMGGSGNLAIQDMAASRQDYFNSIAKLGPTTEFEVNGVKVPADQTRTGAFGPDDIGKKMREYDDMIVGSRILGQFSRSRKIGQGERFIQDFMDNDAWLKQVTPEQRDKLAHQMHADLAFDKSANGAEDHALGLAVKNASEAIYRGEQVGGLDQLAVQAQGTKYEGPLRSALGYQDQMAKFVTLPPEQQATMIQQQRAALKTVKPADQTPESVEAYGRAVGDRTTLVQAMQTARTATIKALDEDTFGFAQRAGVIPQAEPLFVDGRLNIDGMRERSLNAAYASKFYGHASMPMAQEEVDAFGRALGGMTAPQQAASLGALVDGFGAEGSVRVFEALDKKGYSLHAAVGGMAAQEIPAGRTAYNGREAGAIVLRGMELLNPPDGSKSVMTLPPPADLNVKFQEGFGDLMVVNPVGRGSIRDAVLNAYAGLSAGAGDFNQTAVDSERFTKAVQLVFGGPLVDFNGPGFGAHVKLQPPFRGATQRDFNGWWDNLSGPDIKAAGGLANYDDEHAARIIRERGVPVEIGQGSYMIVLDATAATLLDAPPLANGKGKPLILNFPVPK